MTDYKNLVEFNSLTYLPTQARSQDFAWGGGGGGGGRERRGVLGYPPPGNFEETGYLRQHSVRFEDSLLGNKAGKSERH